MIRAPAGAPPPAGPLEARWSLLLLAFALSCGPSRGTIGALLLQDPEKRLIVQEVPPGLAADRAGVEVGDEVLLIDGRDVRPMSADTVHAALSGEVGEGVRLTLVRQGNIVRVRLDRTAAERLRPPKSGSAEPPSDAAK